MSKIVTGRNARFKGFGAVALLVMAHTTWTSLCTHQDNDLQSRRGCEVAWGLSWSRVNPILSHRSSLVGNAALRCAARGVRCQCTASKYGLVSARCSGISTMDWRGLSAPVLIARCMA